MATAKNIALDTTSNAHTPLPGAATTLAWAHTISRVVGYGAPILVVCVEAEAAISPPAVSTVSWKVGATTLRLTQAVTKSNTNIISQIWYILNPSVIGAGTITITYTGGGIYASYGGIAISLDGVDPLIQPDSGGVSASGTSATPSVGVKSKTRFAWDICALTVDRTSAVAPSDNVIHNDDIGIDSHHGASYAKNIDPPGTYTMNWTGGNAADVWALTGISIRPSRIRDMITSNGVVPFNR